MTAALLSMEELSQILKAAVYAGSCSRTDTHPVSIFLVAKPERGKTSVALASAGKHSVVLTDCSAIGLLEELKSHPEATHIILTDLTSVSGHRETVQRLTISILNGLAEEGTYTIALPHLQHLQLNGRRVGIIACLTPDLLSDNRMWWNRSGFSSRVLILRYDHGPALINRILNSIARHNGKTQKASSHLVLPKPQHVKIPARYAQEILNMSQVIAQGNEELGYRKQKQFRSLACGHALIHSRRAVCKIDIQFLESVLNYVQSEVKLK